MALTRGISGTDPVGVIDGRKRVRCARQHWLQAGQWHPAIVI